MAAVLIRLSTGHVARIECDRWTVPEGNDAAVDQTMHELSSSTKGVHVVGIEAEYEEDQ